MDEASVASGRKKAMASDEGGSGGRMDGWVEKWKTTHALELQAMGIAF